MRVKNLIYFNMMITLLIVLGGCSIFQSGKAKSPNTVKKLTKEIDNIFNDKRFENAFWGAWIESLDTGKIWYQRNPGKVFLPASNQKILTTAATLEELGPDFKFSTSLCADGEIKSSTLDGNLVVFSNGDPSMSDNILKDPRDVFFMWADKLTTMGITKITGDIIGDDNAFDDERLGALWSFSYLDVWYAAEINPLVFNENVIDITIIPPETVDGEIKIVPNINSSYFKIINNLKLIKEGKRDFSFVRKYGTNDIELSGDIVAGGKKTSISVSIFNPTLYYTTVLKEVLEAKGIKVEGKPADCDDIAGWSHKPADFKILDEYYSPPLSVLAKQLMKRSQNLYAEIFVRALGWKATGLGTFKAGREIVQKRLAEFGISPDEYEYSDGSGLTRYNYVTPGLIVRILKGMLNSPNKQYWVDSMPIAGIDGTLKWRMRNTPAENNVRAKTGTISNTRGLSGYVTTADGEKLVFSFLVNSHLKDESDTNDITDSILALIAGFKR